MAILLAALAVLAAAAPAAAVTGDELLANPGLEMAGDAGPLGWTPEAWGDIDARFSHPAGGAHGGTRSVRVEVVSRASGDAKWVPDPVAVEGGRYYVFADWYRSDVTSSVSVYYERATDEPEGGTWASLFSGIPPAGEWTPYRSGFTMPADAVRAVFVHFVAAPGFLQTDDYSVTEQSAPPGFTAPMLSLTFDNASQAFHDRALPVLDAHGFKTTQYVPTYGLTTRPLDRALMTPLELAELARDGHEIGSHSVTHPDLTTLPDAALAEELRASKSLLETIVGLPVGDFAYPFGSYDARVIGALRSAGYTLARSVEEGYNSRLDLEPYDIRVQNMLRTTTVAEFRSWLDYARTRGYWLVVVYHEVVPDRAPPCALAPAANPCLGDYDTTASSFAAQLDAIDAAGLGPAVMTAARAFAAARRQLSGPGAGTVLLSPSQPATDSVLTATPGGFEDPDGEPVSHRYRWFVNGVPLDAGGPQLDLGPAGHGDRGDVVGVEVQAADATGNASAAVRTAVTVVNAPPRAGTVTISPADPAPGSALAAEPAGFADADGDRLTYRYAWSRNGVALADLDGATVVPQAAAGDLIGVAVRAEDGSGGVSPPAVATVALRSGGTVLRSDSAPPRIRFIWPRGRRYRVGSAVPIRFTCRDASGIRSCRATLRREGARARTVRSGIRIRLQRPGRYVLRVVAVDRAGNRQARSLHLRILRR